MFCGLLLFSLSFRIVVSLHLANHGVGRLPHVTMFSQNLHNGVNSCMASHFNLATCVINLCVLLAYEGCPKCCATLLYFSQNQQEMSAILPVVNFESPVCYCSAAE
jgi:hypothetical protein